MHNGICANTSWKVGLNFFCLCLTDKMGLAVGKPFKGKKEKEFVLSWNFALDFKLYVQCTTEKCVR